MKKMMLTLKNLLFLFKTQVKESPKSVFYELVYGFFSSFRPFAAILIPKFILDGIIGGQKPSFILMMIALLSVLEFVFSYICSFIVEVQSVHNEKVPHVLLLLLAQKAAKVDYCDMERNDLVVRYQQAQNTTFGLAGITMGIFNSFVSSFFKIATLIYIMASLNLGIVIILLVFVVVSLGIERWTDTKEFGYQMQENQCGIELSLIFLCSSFPQLAKDIRLYEGAAFFDSKYRRAFDKQEAVIRKHKRFSAMADSLSHFVNVLQSGVVYGFVIITYLAGKISIGSFSMYLSATAEFYSTISSLLGVANNLNQTNMFMEQYKNFLDYPENMVTSGEKISAFERGQAEIEFRNVSFCYPGQEADALHDVNVRFSLDQTIGIVGENGAGKSTFVKLLLRLYDVSEGEILLNGVNIKEYSYPAYLSLFSGMFQDYQLFSYSIKDNIGFEQAGERLEEVESAIDDVVLRDKVNGLVNGLDTYVNPNYHNGTSFSGGEMQRIALARAFFKNGSIMVLDEPNAAIDPLTEQAIYRSIEKRSGNKLVLHISHRLSSTRDCDRILVFDRGTIAESGRHMDLMQKAGIYSTMFNLQAQYYQT